MSAKQTTKAPEQSAEKKAPPVPRKDVQVRVKTKATGAKRTNSGVIFTNEWKYLTLDDKGSAYKAISDDPALTVELAPPPAKPAADEPGKEAT
ncbi:hypothetical protein HaloA020_29590 [Halomonas sp. A020]|uniref:hypothetical protein n=1 Tax=Halomonas sp. A020 TaxID=2717374 RepID=UPI00248F6BB8|nr:hypothetical protein [Halomonas sp. A020]BCB62258.1 hypothetical protein HaloA020_29590 [Halomonas sp. A020]